MGTTRFGPDRNPIEKKVVVDEIKDGQLALRVMIQP
jgi:hypothetical protein